MVNDDLRELSEYLRALLVHFHPEMSDKFSGDQMRRVTEALLAEASARRWMDQQIGQLRLKAADYANGEAMELALAQESAEMWVGICRGLLEDAPNYSETKFDSGPADSEGKIVMETHLAGASEVFTMTVQRHGPGKLTPHEARMKAEDAIHATWQWITTGSDNPGHDVGELKHTLEHLGYPEPTHDEGEGT